MTKHCYRNSIWILSFLFTLTIAQNDFNLACPTDWTKQFEKCYKAVPTLRSWVAADEYCQKYGGRLARPSGYVINNWVSTLFSGSSTQYWISYNVRGMNNNQRYAGQWSDGVPVTQKVGIWGDYEPTTSMGDCVRVAQSSGNKWFMDSCDRLLPSVCELTGCPDDTFRCTMTGKCLGNSNICDGVDDCGDSSDERNCPTVQHCKYYLTGTSGTVTWPTTGNAYPASSTCMWTIEAPAGTRIQVQMTNFNTETDIDVLEFWEGSPSLFDSQCLARLSGTSIEGHQVIMSSNNFLIVRFVTDATVQNSGFSFTWRTDFQCQIAKLPNTRYTTGQSGNPRLLTTNQDFSDCESQCSDEISCTGFSYHKKDNNCFLLTEVALPVPDNCCDLYVKTCLSTRNNPVQSDIPALGRTVTGTTYNQYIYSPLYPIDYPAVETAYIIQSPGTYIITLEVKDIDLCGTDTVVIKDGDNPITPTLATLTSSSATGEIIMSTGNRMYVYMNLKNNLKCRGVLLAYKAACNFVITRNAGTIFSPGYGVQNYPGAIECFWSLRPSNGRTLRLTFTDFQVESNKDYLQAWIGIDDKGTPIHTGSGYSGSTPPPLVSNTGKLAVKFLTSAVGNMRGFTATFTTGCILLSDTAYTINPGRQSINAGDQSTVTCNTGYTFQAPYAGETNVQLTCQNDGEYDKTVPVCSQAFCGMVPIVANSYVTSSNGISGGNQASYSCFSGYSTSLGTTSFTISCQSDSTWETPSTCIASTCPSLTLAVTAGRRETIYGDGTSHDSILAYFCDQNYESMGPSRIVCTSGTWSRSAATCQKIRCPPQYVTNGTTTHTGVLYQGNDVTVTCNTGYQVTGTNPYKCGIQTPPTCQNIDECTAGTATCNQNCVDYNGGYYCTCNSGYRISPTNPTICEDIDECAYNNGNCDHSCADVEGSYSCSCNVGYNLYPYNGYQGLNLQSGEDGRKPWHTLYINHTCVLKQCSSPAQTISGGLGRSLSLQLIFTQGNSVQYLCNVGYVIAGTVSSTISTTCQVDGTWSPAIPTCQVATCSLDVTADNGVTPTTNINYGSTYQLSCPWISNTRYTLTRYCAYKPYTNRYGTVGDVLQCPAINCGTPMSVSGSNAFSLSCSTFGCSFTFSCSGTFAVAGASGLTNNNVVKCHSNGRWDFGSLHCISSLCTDPGTPPGATQVASTYEVGALVYYTCSGGYSPSPVYPLKCIYVGGQARWNVTYNGNDPVIPTCVDTTSPTFVNCQIQDITVPIYTAPQHSTPTASDNSGLVQSVTTTPANHKPSHRVPYATTVTYTARDTAGNTATCSFNIRIKDEVPPTISCRSNIIYTIDTQSTTHSVDPLSFKLASEQGATVTANTQSFVLTSADVGKVRMVTLTAIDASSNTASCTVQVYTTVSNQCQDWRISGTNTQKTCTTKAGNLGRDCTFSCLPSYYFVNEGTSTSVTVSCFNNNDWNRAAPSCTARSSAYRRITVAMSYNTGTITNSQACTTYYQTQLQNQYNTLATNLQNMCNSQSTSALTLVQPQDGSVPGLAAEYNSIRAMVFASFSFDMTPATHQDAAYTSCATSIITAFQNKASQVNPILSVAAQAQNSCPSISSSQVSYFSTPRNYFVCLTNAGVQTAGTKTYCHDCPLGYYSSEKRQCIACEAGKYLATTNRDSCDLCPTGTRSLKTGLTSQQDCYLSCPLGFTSTTGEVSSAGTCNQCGLDSFSSNALSCTSCGGNKTRGVGQVSVQDCLSPCQAGYYSYDGLDGRTQRCTACPRNFYQASTGQTQCQECASNQYTTQDGRTSPAHCVNANSALCGTNPCENGGTCEVINHDYFCTCPQGYTGNTCTTPVDPCAISPCYNNGQCTGNHTTYTYTCTCTSNRFSGDRCQTDINDCAFSNNFNPCNNGSCHDLIGGYACLCPSFSGATGPTCSTPLDPCATSSCTRGTCVAYDSIRRICECPAGYTGESCDSNIDECVSSPCVNGGTCVDGVNSFTCSCTTGFSGAFCHVRGQSSVCSGSCGSSQTCIDYYPQNQPLCMCPNGYNDNGNNCELVSYCGNTPCLNSGTCISSYGTYICKCSPGYAGQSCQYTIDNCVSQPCQNNGVCQNAVNSFSCTCPVTGTGGTLCEDNKNNCSPYPCVIANTKQCFDRINHYYCDCKPGFRGNTCSEGAVDCNSFPCQHGGTCAATSTGYQCSCATGYYGNNCENIVDNCSPTSPCTNSGTCYNSVTSYKCVCQPDYRGSTCQTNYDLCDITSPCVGPNSTCSLDNGRPKCQCISGYQGDSCNQRIAACTSTSCLNGATCSETGGSVTCSCVPGYTGTQCGTNINECATNPCPTAATCIDGINTYTCQCNNGKIGANCDKDLSYRFDLILQPGLMCKDIEGITMNTVFGLSTTKLSVSVWVRFTTTSTKDILALYTLDTLTATPEMILKISSNGISGSINSNAFSLSYGAGNSAVSISNGVWHHIVVTWNALNTEDPNNQIGLVLLYVDNTLKGRQENVGTNHQLPSYGYLVVGGTYHIATKMVTTANGITGKISRLILSKEEFAYASTISTLFNNYNYIPSSNVIHTPIAYIVEKGGSLIDYKDELTAGICRTVSSCNSGTSLPTVNCPGDQSVVSTARINTPTWTEATFTGAASGRVYYNMRSGSQQTWGMSSVSTVGYDSSDNAAVCVFRFYNQRGGCTAISPSNPVGGTQTCSSITGADGRERCTVTCSQSSHQLSQPGPYYYTCSKYSMFGVTERLVPYHYPPCAAAVRQTVNVNLKLTYVNMTTNCEDYKTTLQQQLRTTFSTVNNQWSQDLCNAANCNSVQVPVDCTSTTEANVEVLFRTVDEMITNSQSVIRPPQEVIAITVVDDKSLKYSQASPVLSSMEISLVPYCIDGQQIVGNYCVSCVPGSYYDSNTGKCVPCLIGQYQSSSGQPSCTSCETGKTTYSTGTQSSTLCYTSCSVGMYYSLTANSPGCVFCPVGFYQPARGSFFCLPCGFGLTTANLGATQGTSCVDPATITSTNSPPDTGAATVGGGLSGGEIAAIVLAIFVILLLLLLLFFCCCRDRLPCFGKGMVEPEDKTPFRYVNRYGDTDIMFTSYKLHDIREKRGVRPLERKPRYDYSGEDTRSVHTDISVQVPVFMEKLDGSVSNRKTYYSNTNTARSLLSDQDLEVELPKKKKRRTKKGGKRKRRAHHFPENEENMENHIYEEPPTSTPRAMAPPPPSTALPKSLKPLPNKYKTPSEASFGTNSTYLKSKTDPSSSGVFSSSDFRKSKKEYTIKIDDDEDYR